MKEIHITEYTQEELDKHPDLAGFNSETFKDCLDDLVADINTAIRDIGKLKERVAKLEITQPDPVKMWEALEGYEKQKNTKK